MNTMKILKVDDKSASIEFVFERKIMINANQPLHSFVKRERARKLRELASSLACEKQFNFFTIECVICPPTRRRLDPPNLSTTTKHLIDGLTDTGWWVDDDWTHLDCVSFRYGGISGGKGIFKIIFNIKEIERE